MCKFMFSVCNITFQIMSYVQVYVFCLQYHIPNIVVCASLCFLFAISHSKYVACASLCFLFAISHSKYSHMCKFIFSVCNITFQIMSYVQVYVFCLQYHIPNMSYVQICFLFAISHSKFAYTHSVCNITFQISSYVQVYIFCLQYHIPNNVVCASLCFLFAISHSKYSRMRKFMFSVCNITFQIMCVYGLCFLFAISHSK